MNDLNCTEPFQLIVENTCCPPKLQNTCTFGKTEVDFLSQNGTIYITSFCMMTPAIDLTLNTILFDLCAENNLDFPSRLYDIRKTPEQLDLENPSSKLRILQESSCSCEDSPLNLGEEFKDEENVIEDFAVGKFMRFLKRLRFRKLLAKIKDLRDPKKTEYKIEVILQWALSVFFFRSGSTNALQTAFEKIPKHRRRALWNYFGLDPEKTTLPHRTVVTDCLSLVDQDEINHLLEQLFKWALKNKIFYNHMEKLLPDFTYHLACDGVWVHKYTCPHSVDEDGKCNCPYCLPRVHNKGKENEYTDYLHAFVNLAFILPGGIQLPIYVYPLKAKQLEGHEAASAEKHKQECEIQAAHLILPRIKKQFPRLSITLITDSLYANEPLLKLCNELDWDFLIVRQVGSLKKVARHCDGLEKAEIYQNYRATEIIKLKNGGRIERKIKWFNKVNVGNEIVHVIRFEEIEYDAAGNIAKNKEDKEKRFKTEWLSSTPIRKENCFKLAERARMRADHEDLHCTLKTRGFAANHDYARSNPNACLIWKLLMFVAFWIFELFSCTKLAQDSKGSGSWMALARELLEDLKKIRWSELRLSPSLRKENLQFRYVFP